MSNEQKAVTFVTSRYKGLEMVMTPMGLKDAQGNKVRSVRCFFAPTGYGYACTTSDPKIVAWLDNHDSMKKGVIQRFDPRSIPAKAPAVEVSDGVTSKEKEPTESLKEKPVEGSKPPHAVKIKK